MEDFISDLVFYSVVAIISAFVAYVSIGLFIE